MRGLALFWAALLLLCAAGAVTLQVLGPPPSVVAAVPVPHAAPAPSLPVHAPAPPRGVAPPDPALLERVGNATLPRIGADGRLPRIVYAAPVPADAGTPRVAILVGGFGAAERDSRAVLDGLPGPVSLAVSAYAASAGALVDAARGGGHEVLASIPMEPAGFPANDAGPNSLLTGASPAENDRNLLWALGQVPGAVGATGASDGMRGERFAETALGPVLSALGRRGLLYVDPRPGAVVPGPAARSVDVVLDETPGRAGLEGRLASLERVAREKGSAIGLLGLPSPAAVERVSEWVKGMKDRGVWLVPVSALVNGDVPGGSGH